MPEQHANVVPGWVYWVTGLTGAGKSTVAAQLILMLRKASQPALQLDGDVMREIFPRGGGHRAQDRLELSMGYSRLCQEVAAQGIDVVCATVSMFHEVHRWNRAHIANYREIFLSVPREERERRDAKGLYKAFKEGAVRDMVGLDVEAEFPEAPDMVIDNYRDVSPQMAAQQIWDAFIASKVPGCDLGAVTRVGPGAGR